MIGERDLADRLVVLLRRLGQLTASTSVSTLATRIEPSSVGSDRNACNTGAGSARPEVSITTLSNSGISAASRVIQRVQRSDEIAAHGAAETAVLQHDHRSELRANNLWSSPTSPNSLTTTSVFDSSGSAGPR